MTPRSYTCVLAIFCDSQLDVTVFESALRVCHEHGAKLVILDVRHQHAASTLGTLLQRHGALGRGAVERLQQQVKDQRSKVIRRILDEMQQRAEREGLAVEVREEKGEFHDVVRRVSHDVSAGAAVIQRTHHTDLEGAFDVVRV
jgi:hypothetical protein